MVHPSHRDEIGAESVARPARIRADSAVAEEALPDSEALFRTLAETSSTLISLFDGDQVTYVNPAMQAALGITEADVPTLRIKGSLIASTERQEARATIDALQRGEITDPVRFERASVRGDGRQRWLEMTFAMVDLREGFSNRRETSPQKPRIRNVISTKVMSRSTPSNGRRVCPSLSGRSAGPREISSSQNEHAGRRTWRRRETVVQRASQ